MQKENIKHKILVVDDIAKNIQIIGNILLGEKYDVSFALSGEDTIKLVHKEKFDLILLDIIMPGMNGFEVCTKIKSDPETNNIPIIFLTAKSDTDSIVKGFKIGGQDYLTKPFNEDELLARVNTQLQLKSQQEQLKSINEELEVKVKRRTFELEQANKKLALLDNAKNTFLKLISHELRTPLNAINGFIEILYPSLKSTEHKESINYLKKSSDRLIDLSDTALLITELQLGQYSYQFKDVLINQLVDDIFIIISERVIEKNITIRKNFDTDNLHISCDYELIKNCIKKILINAIAFSGNNSEIILNSWKNKNEICFEIIDNGPGFSEDNFSNFFEFFQKDEINFNKEGFGLGLATVKLIMDIHGGRVNIKNRDEGGAVVQLFFLI